MRQILTGILLSSLTVLAAACSEKRTEAPATSVAQETPAPAAPASARQDDPPQPAPPDEPPEDAPAGRFPDPPPDAATVKRGDRWINSLGMEFVYIAPGEFMMGSPEDEEGRQPDETLHRVVLTRGFWISEAEVTQKQWMETVAYINSRFRGPDLPVDSVSWDDVKDFCRQLSAKEGHAYRLPTEAEWEYACRAGTTTPFGLGATITSFDANIDGTKTYGEAGYGVLRGKTVPVKSFAPNAWGLYDMHGNAWELCEDFYGEDYYQNAPEQDPKGPETGERRVVRGGSWRGPAKLARAAHRHRTPPDYRHFYFGFRVVLEP